MVSAAVAAATTVTDKPAEEENVSEEVVSKLVKSAADQEQQGEDKNYAQVAEEEQVAPETVEVEGAEGETASEEGEAPAAE